jgi:tagatose 1,6-diphosphate aldolase
VKLTPGKLAGLKAVSDDRGVIAAVAMDQRGSLKKMLGPAAGDKELEQFKAAVAEVLSPHASAVLLDPEWGLPAARKRASNAGLLLAYEKTGYDKVVPGRLPDLLDHWSVRRLKEAGADCVKIIVYYSPCEPDEINDQKHAWVERVGDECRAHDMPLFLELLCYEEGVDPKSIEYARHKPEIVRAGMAEFDKGRYGVDVMKVEVPINMKFVEGTNAFQGEKAYTLAEAMEHFRHVTAATTRPFIFLSGGVSNEEFTETLALAAQSGIKYNGVLCGRATWKDGIAIFAEKGDKALREWLKNDGVRNIQNVNESLKTASSWFPIYDVEEMAAAR